MKYPIIQVKTPDGLWLYGLFIEAPKSKTIFVNIHGTASNFYEEYFIEVMTEKFMKEGISMLSTNNRGAGVYDAYQKTGAATERFEDCVIDIDAWIDFALKKGYTKIVLSGHSLGTEKVVYYMNHGKNVGKVFGIVLLAPADSYGSHRIHNGKDNTAIYAKIQERLKEANELIKQGKGDTFLPRDTYGSHGGIMPKSANSLADSLGPQTKLLEGLPIATGKLDSYSKIKVPILVTIGDQEEYTALSIKDTLDLMKRENDNTQTVQFKNCNHDFEGCEETLSKAVTKFITNINQHNKLKP